MELTDQHLKDLLKSSREDVLWAAAEVSRTNSDRDQLVYEKRGEDETALVLEAFSRGWTVEQIGNAQNGIEA